MQAKGQDGPCPEAHCGGPALHGSWLWNGLNLSSLAPPPRFSGGWPTGGFHGGFVAPQCGSSRTSGPGFHLCSGSMRTFSVLESATVAAGQPGQTGVRSSPNPCCESTL